MGCGILYLSKISRVLDEIVIFFAFASVARAAPNCLHATTHFVEATVLLVGGFQIFVN